MRGVHGVILAGVHAWGSDVLERVATRPLLPVADRPLIAHVLTWLREAGIHEASVCANSDTPALQRHLGDGSAWGVRLDYQEDVMPRGPAGCVRDAIDGRDAEACLVVDGTVVPDFDLRALLAFHRESQAAMTVVAATSDAPGSRGGHGLDPTGIYVFAPSAWKQVATVGYQDIKEKLIPQLIGQGQVVALYPIRHGGAPRVSGAASYLTVSRWAVRRLAAQGTPADGYRLVDEALIHVSAIVEPSARLRGPVLVGPRSVVGHHAVITGPTAIGADSRIERAAILSRSMVWSRCVVGEGAVVDQSILTDGAVVEPDDVLRNTVYVDPRACRAAAAREPQGARRTADESAANERNSVGAGERGDGRPAASSVRPRSAAR